MNNILHDSNLKITSLVENFMENSLKNENNPFALSDFTDRLMNYLMELGRNVLIGVIDVTEEAIFESKSRQEKYGALYKRGRDVLTIFGKVSYERRLYYEIDNQENTMFLTDNYLDILKGERLLQNVNEKLIKIATDLSYEKSSEHASYGEKISKQTVKNKLNELEFNAPAYVIPKEKRKCSVLYVQADEDHVSLQSGGIVMPRIVTIHEGSINGKLKNAYTICGIYDGKIDDLWEEVLTYIENIYDYERIEKIILMGDGASWIKQGLEWLAKSVYVADKFHIFKAVTALSCGDFKVKDVLIENIFNIDFETFKLNCETIIDLNSQESKKKKLNKLLNYILNNKEGIKKFILWDICGCSAEGHVSHVLADRLSSRPLGWSIKNTNTMSKLRAMQANKEDIRLITRNSANISKEKNIQYEENKKIRKKIKKIKYNNMSFAIPEMSYGDKEYRMKLKELLDYKVI